MTEWTAHRFSGGALALDLANTVVWKDDAARRTDRLRVPADIEAFAAAAIRYSSDTTGRLSAPANQADTLKLVELRLAIDNWLRPKALRMAVRTDIAQVFRACLHATENTDESHLAHACALSALQFFQPDIQARVKVCPACHWLFLDRSKNQSRRWCDMKVCGNRAKAQQHYESKKQKGKARACSEN
jgi:predicted RNA-binding Zn ribbon-like protein